MPIVDIVFPVRGGTVPADHGYQLFSALNRVIPYLHGNPSVSIHPLRGQLAGNRSLRLTRESVLTVRASHELYASLLKLAGRDLTVGSNPIRLGVPRVLPLTPYPSLCSKLVTIKPYMEPESFLGAAGRQLEALGITAKPTLIPRPLSSRPFEGQTGSRSPFVRRTIAVRGRAIVGFALQIHGLSPEDSLLLQSKGLGGRHRMGCGIFVPAQDSANT